MMMTVVELNKIAKKLSDLMPLFSRKLFRPLEQLTKNITSPLQMHAITILREKELFSMTELSNEMNISKQQMTPIIDKLIDSGFVQREHDDIDRRSIKISLTSIGIDFLDDISKEMTSFMKSQIEGLDEDDLHSLNHALDDLYRIIKKISKS
jgi:DNA-binding MarR family transcriptional regulator